MATARNGNEGLGVWRVLPLVGAVVLAIGLIGGMPAADAAGRGRRSGRGGRPHRGETQAELTSSRPSGRCEVDGSASGCRPARGGRRHSRRHGPAVIELAVTGPTGPPTRVGRPSGQSAGRGSRGEGGRRGQQSGSRQGGALGGRDRAGVRPRQRTVLGAPAGRFAAEAAEEESGTRRRRPRRWSRLPAGVVGRRAHGSARRPPADTPPRAPAVATTASARPRPAIRRMVACGSRSAVTETDTTSAS